ncbi:hypothetical protein CBS101457_003695 [Exobasidium rhododendri]|nr:hypothetical protein CBS101457_003695 [Exobasidium rhododendri]
MSSPAIDLAGSSSEAKISAGDAAKQVHLPSNRNSVDYDLQPIGKHEKVSLSADIVQDKKTGKHYHRVKKPTYSVARSKGAARIDHSAYRGAPIGLGHTLPGFSKEYSQGRNDHNDGGMAAELAAREQAMFERMRMMMREEIRNANRGHRDEMKQHIEEAIEKNKDDDGGSNDTTYNDDKKIRRKTGDDGKTVLDPSSAERGDSELEDEDEPDFPNPWTKIRYHCREPFAEFLACFVLLTFGDGINVQVQLSALVDPSMPKGEYLSISFGWGIAVMAAIICHAKDFLITGISGGHINPGITLTLACFRGFPWRKVPIYWAAQLLGAISGALCIYGLYVIPIRMVDPMQTQTTAELFCTFPASFLEGSAMLHAFTAYNEIYATAILLIVVLAIGDSSNAPPTEGMAPIVLLWTITGIGATLGWQTAYSINPIRDWGPRIALTIVGYKGLWSYQNGYFAYTPLVSSMTGALLGAFLYDLFIYEGGESWINKPWTWKASAPRFGRSSLKKMPAGVSGRGDEGVESGG